MILLLWKACVHSLDGKRTASRVLFYWLESETGRKRKRVAQSFRVKQEGSCVRSNRIVVG
jgi:hypothetical protein